MIKILILVVSISTLCNFAHADKWYDEVGDNIATGIGDIIGGASSTGLITKRPTCIFISRCYSWRNGRTSIMME